MGVILLCVSEVNGEITILILPCAALLSISRPRNALLRSPPFPVRPAVYAFALLGGPACPYAPHILADRMAQDVHGPFAAQSGRLPSEWAACAWPQAAIRLSARRILAGRLALYCPLHPGGAPVPGRRSTPSPPSASFGAVPLRSRPPVVHAPCPRPAPDPPPHVFSQNVGMVSANWSSKWYTRVESD